MVLLWQYSGCPSVSFLGVSAGDFASEECLVYSRGLPHRFALFNWGLFDTNIREGRVSYWWRGTSYTKASADQSVCNYLFQLSIKGGAFYSSKAEIWQFPSCEILLTKVLSQGQGNVVCWAPVPSSLWPGHVSGPHWTDFDLMTIKGQEHNGIRCVSGGEVHSIIDWW